MPFSTVPEPGRKTAPSRAWEAISAQVVSSVDSVPRCLVLLNFEALLASAQNHKRLDPYPRTRMGAQPSLKRGPPLFLELDLASVAARSAHAYT